MKKMGKKETMPGVAGMLALVAAAVPVSAFAATGAGKNGDIGSRKDDKRQRPNILLICPEDNGVYYGCYGYDVETPNVDALAKSGVRFERAFCPQAGSSPGRACFLTGLYPHQNGQVGLSTWSYSMYREDTPNIINSLKAAGYHTGMVGKLHVNPESAFDIDWHKINEGNFAREGLERYAGYSKEFISQCGNDPFYLQVNFPDTHLPFKAQVDGVPETVLTMDDVEAFPFLGVTSETMRKATANYLNCVRRLDHYVGELIKVLEECGKMDNTLIIYLADHGVEMLRSKMTAYDQGLRIPMIICWPGHALENYTYEGIVSGLDIYPTVLEAAGLDIPGYLPGKSLMGAINGKKLRHRKYFVAEYNSHYNKVPYPQRSVRTRRYHLIWNPLHGTVNPHIAAAVPRMTDSLDFARALSEASQEVQEAYKTTYCPPEFELYDLENDPHEFVNIAYDPEYTRLRNKMMRRLVQWQEKTKDAFLDTTLARKFFNDVLEQGDDRSVFPYRDYMDPHVDFSK